MEWNKKLAEWKAAGTEPPESLKESGFTAGYKPPAAYFNWLFNTTYEALKEIRNNVNKTDDKANIVVMKDGDIPVAEREKNAWYLKVTNVQSYRSMRAGPGGLAARIIGEEDEAWQNH